MASKSSYYVVKRGDTLWKIASSYKSKISGKTVNDKIATLKEVNGIEDVNLIYVGQHIYFSADDKNKTLETTKTRPEITGFGLKSPPDNDDGRSMVAYWSWSKTSTEGYTCRWEEYRNGSWGQYNEDEDINHYESRFCHSEYTADKVATKVRFKVRPYDKKDSKGKPVYWSTDVADWSELKTYDFSDNPPLVPPTPTVELDESDDRKLVISISNIDYEKLDAKYINFDVYKNNTTKVKTIEKATINTGSHYVKAECQVEYGNTYTVRAQSVSAKGKTSGWSTFSSEVGTKPAAPKSIKEPYCRRRDDNKFSVYLEWSSVPNATSYLIEYTTNEANFNSVVKNWEEVPTGADTLAEIPVTDASDYYFRVKAVNDEGTSNPSSVVHIAIGLPPAAPTSWSSSNSVFVGESMELNWTHNARDSSVQSMARLRLKIGDGTPIEKSVTNGTTSTSGDEIKKTQWTYAGSNIGTFVSYKGELHFEMNTNDSLFKNKKIQWQVQTAGVSNEFSNEEVDWSSPCIIYIYEKPTLNLSLTKDEAGNRGFSNVYEKDEDGNMVLVATKALTSFPFYIRAEVVMTANNIQTPVGYHLRIVANEFYETVDEVGRTKVINQGDAVYSKYFDANGRSLVVEMTADNIDLEPLISYSVHCDVDMSTGLAISADDEFNVYWDDVDYKIGATVIVNKDSYTTTIVPVCEDSEGSYVDGITLSVYRSEYNGTYTEVATNIPNNGTAVTDPHPALDYARYRVVAKVAKTGAVSFYDLPPYEVGCTSVVVQWNEDWSSYDVNGAVSVDTPVWSGSMLVLPYNVKISDKRTRDTSRVTYAGREYPVLYHGTAINESSSWTTVIPKDDTDTIYALRRLSLWAGPVYVREPSGMGFWANVIPSFSIDGTSLTIPVTLDVTRVEGGV